MLSVFSRYGEIIDIIVKKNKKLRGQAFIIFKNRASSIVAKNCLNDTLFMGKQIRIDFSKQKSNVFLSYKGEYINKQKSNKNNLQKNKDKLCEFLELKEKELTNENSTSNRIFVKNINEEITLSIIESVFKTFKGFISAKLMKGYAIVEYSSKEHAEVALNNTNNQKLTHNCRIIVEYAK